jgi:hypothetical protein
VVEVGGDRRSIDPDAWGVSLQLVSEPPVPPGALTGLLIVVADTSGVPPDLNLAVHWPADADVLDPIFTGARAFVLHPCTSGHDPIDVRIETCRSGEEPPGCFSLSVDGYGARGSFTHPSGLRCSISGAQGDFTLRTTAGGDWGTEEFRRSDVMVGWFDARCSQEGTVVMRLEGTFQLPVFRSALSC